MESEKSEGESVLLLEAQESPPPPYESVLAETSHPYQDEVREETEKKVPEKEEPKSKTDKKKKNEESKEIVYKSSKQLYRAIAAQWGITCKMSDRCRCFDCQSEYFDCEYDRENEQEKTDGGLGAGTPMFISEVIHGSACSIL